MGEEVKKYSIEIDDPVKELRKATISDDRGVYFVFSAKEGDGAYTLIRLLYIGRSNDVQQRVNGKHHKYGKILAECKKDQGVPVYYYGDVTPSSKEDMVRTESALIFSKGPELNETADKEFHHPDTYIQLKRKKGCRNENNAIPAAFRGDEIFVAKGQKKN